MVRQDIAQDIDTRKPEDLQGALTTADMILGKSYLNSLSTRQIVQQKTTVAENLCFLTELNNTVRFFDTTQIVLNKNENVRDKLISVFNAVGSAGAGLLMLIHGDEKRVSIKFGVKAYGDGEVGSYGSILQNSLKGNFPGTKINAVRKENLQAEILSSFPQSCSVATVTDIAGMRSEEETKDRQFMQGMEKLIDTMQGRRYTMLLIADPVSLADLNASRHALENLYSSLVPFSESQMTVGTNETESITSTITKGTTETVNQSLSKTVTHTTNTSTSTADGINHSILFLGINHTLSTVQGKADAEGTQEMNGTGTSIIKQSAEGNQHGTGSSQSLQIKFEDHAVKQIMKRIDKILERYDTCADVGMWNCAMYCIAENAYDAQMAANVYHSIVRGKNSSVENGGVTVWDTDKAPLIVNSLKYMSHPYLAVDFLTVTPGTLISSMELAIHAGLPNHSVPGIPVIECAEFGRTVSSYDAQDYNDSKNYSVRLGKIWHMNQQEELPVNLNPDSLASHTFITGSTGSGKSNTIYQILSECIRLGHTFLVIEPAKGEYKHLFGSRADVSVFGTNPELSPLLRINPFSFPHGNKDPERNIHILEHLDRLIEIFNVCWPMYAAMPAVLKEAVEKSYEDCGWNLTESTNEYGDGLYPTFADVTRNIRTIIDSSEYDSDNKGAYKGSLITRLKSLTNGINGLIFATDEIAGEDLFDKNLIVDLSRVGSAETKSLIMGLLVLKLQEHRMTCASMNAPLRHVTVLEEAHNLLKRTSTEQSQESGNLLGKSVEMLGNAIAEMRTYGEGFIIADQAPALLDMAVIRNTNTKIIMRLPDHDDRELVGKAANLDDDQITELAKLPRGVAAVYQNEWVEPVLCKVLRFESDGKAYCYAKPEQKGTAAESDVATRLEIAKLLCNGTAVSGEAELMELKARLDRLNLRAATTVMILKSAKTPPAAPRYTKLAPVVSELFPAVRSAFVSSFARTSDTMQWTDDVDEAIRTAVQADMDEELRRSIRQCIITDYLHNELGKKDLLEQWTKQGGLK